MVTPISTDSRLAAKVLRQIADRLENGEDLCMVLVLAGSGTVETFIPGRLKVPFEFIGAMENAKLDLLLKHIDR